MTPRTNSDNAPDALFFGCARGIDGRRDVGHYFYMPHGGKLDEGYRARLDTVQPWGFPDAVLAPRPRRHDEYPQGTAALHHKDGWTAIGFWDRSGDSRGNSNANFLLRGTFTFDEALALAQEKFPALFERFPFEVTEIAPGSPLYWKAAA